MDVLQILPIYRYKGTCTIQIYLKRQSEGSIFELWFAFVTINEQVALRKEIERNLFIDIDINSEEIQIGS